MITDFMITDMLPILILFAGFNVLDVIAHVIRGKLNDAPTSIPLRSTHLCILMFMIVDVFYCIPSMPVIIIIGAAMDAMRVDSWKRMMYLMLILGFLGWPSIARLVRGQILSLREQEFMLATEACGIKVWHRIFRHLIPNVIPQLIVTCTMGLGSTILTEATLSFLGLGVKYPFASWGNIINDVNNAYVMTNYLFIWIPAGVCLLLTVLGFNFVGDGLRDAFDPKMKR